MACFDGFPPIETNFTPIPDIWFDELMPRITSLAEVKVTEYIFRHTYGWRKECDWITLDQFVNGVKARDGHQLDIGTGLSMPSVVSGIKKAIERGTILKFKDGKVGQERSFYFLNTAQNRIIVEKLESREITIGNLNNLRALFDTSEAPPKHLKSPLKTFKTPLKDFKTSSKNSLEENDDNSLEIKENSDSINTNQKTTNQEPLSLRARELVVSERSIFRSISNEAFVKLVEEFALDKVQDAINSLDKAYRGNKKQVRSPIALLKTALREGFEPLRQPELEIVKGTAEGKSEDSQILDDLWQRVREKNESLPIQIRNSWENFLSDLAGSNSAQAVDTWFSPLVPIRIDGDELQVYAPSETIVGHIQQKWNNRIEKTLQGKKYPFRKIRFELELRKK